MRWGLGRAYGEGSTELQHEAPQAGQPAELLFYREQSATAERSRTLVVLLLAAAQVRGLPRVAYRERAKIHSIEIEAVDGPSVAGAHLSPARRGGARFRPSASSHVQRLIR